MENYTDDSLTTKALGIGSFLRLPVKQEDTARSFRESLINQFIENINRERVGTTYPPVNKKTIAIRINRNPFLKESWQLEGLLKKCKGSDNFSKIFFWAVKIK